MNKTKSRSYDKIKEENTELKMVMRKLTHEMGNALTLLGASVYNLENRIAQGGIGFDIKDLKGDYIYICNLFKDLGEYNHVETLKKKEELVTDIITDIEETFARMDGIDKIDFSVQRMTEIDNVKVYVDITKIRQVIINIAKNCAEAMEDNDISKGKKVIVRVGTEPAVSEGSSEDQKSVVSGESVHIEVEDNGKGIEEEVLGEIFQPMYTHGKKNGTGLGLFVVKKIIEDHQGKVKAVSVQGTGTAIHIYIPAL